MAGSVVESASLDTNYKPLPLSKSIIKSPFYTKSEIELELPDLRAVTKTDIEATFKNRLIKWNNTLQL